MAPATGNLTGGGATAATVFPGIALICTLYNEEGSVIEFLDSVYALDPIPEEFVIVDGDSTDRTNELIGAYVASHPTGMRVRHLVRPDCNRRVTPGAVARGRNVAIESTGCALIAATDAGCRLEPGWLGRIGEALLSGADVAGGWYVADARSYLERCIGRVWLVPPASVNPSNFLPSSRSIAFTRAAWAAAGGYPEWTLVGEDTVFNFSLRARGYGIVYVPDALVRWRIPSTLSAFASLAHRYAIAEGRTRILAASLAKSAVKVFLTVLLFALGVLVHPGWFIVAIAWLALLVGYRHGSDAFDGEFILGLPCAVVVKTIADASYLTGHLRGRLSPPLKPPGGKEP